jgi:arabinose-5-phosphate isomerase
MTVALEPTAFSQVIDLLNLEANAILKTASQLQPDQVEQAVKFLTDCRGKVILLGVGKSGIVARKIAATMTSTGTHALYVHPVDALHGDIGIVTPADVAMLLSNSGETEELIEVLPHLKNRRVPMIAIVGNTQSTIATHADVTLDATVDREACPLNLAPTTSTTVALAIGDALAMTLMQKRGLTPEEFAFNHPAGRLGKRLTLRVEDLMQSGENNPTLTIAASWIEVVSAITTGGAGAVSILDHEDQLVGLVTDGDLRRWVQKTKPIELETLTAQRIMTPNPITVMSDQLAYDALKLMENRASQIAVLPVVDRNYRSIGLLRLHDIFRSGL